MTSVAAVLALCRFGQDAAGLLLWGASAFLQWFVPAGLAAVVADRLRRWEFAAVIVAVSATAAKLPAEVASVGDGWRDAADPEMIGSVIGDTSGGHAWVVQAAAALLILLARWAPPRARRATTAIASAALLAGLSLTGHAVLHEGWLGALHRFNDVLHVLSGGAWFGGLVPVLVILGALGQEAWRGDATLALRRFSRAGHIAVALVLLSGLVNTALVLGRWPTAWSSPYDALLDAKIAAVAAMVGLALVNRYVFTPMMARHSPEARAALRRATSAEVLLGFFAIALVAIFGLLDPG